jgi:hypothetical protein
MWFKSNPGDHIPPNARDLGIRRTSAMDQPAPQTMMTRDLTPEVPRRPDKTLSIDGMSASESHPLGARPTP